MLECAHFPAHHADLNARDARRPYIWQAQIFLSGNDFAGKMQPIPATRNHGAQAGAIMRVAFERGGIYIVFRFRRGDKSQLGLVIKWRRSQLRSSEREGLWRSWSLGPLYIRTHQRLDQPR